MHVLLTCQPSLSHAVQVVGLANALRSAGHGATIATPGSLASVLRGHGLDARDLDPQWTLRPGDPVWDATVGRSDFFGFPDVPTATTIEQLTALAEGIGADVVVREYAEFGGWAVARRLGLPHATVGIMHRLPPPAEAVAVQRAAALAALAGIATPTGMDELLGARYFNPVPDSFRATWERHDAIQEAVAPSLFDGDDGEPSPPWLDELGGDRRLVYVTLGNVFSGVTAVWNAVLRALADQDVDVLATIGDLDPAALAVPSERMRVVRRLPQNRILPRAAAVVCHGGFNSLVGALAHGVPAVALPLGADQPVNAGCLAATGAGINAANAPARDPRGPWTDPDTLQSADIAAAVRAVLEEPRYRQAARAVAAEIAAMPPAAAAVAALERIAVISSTPA